MARGPWARLDQVLDDEAVGAEEPDPFAVRQLEGDLLAVVDDVQPEVVERQPVADPLGIERPADRLDRRVVVEREQAARPQQAGRLGDGQVRVREGHRAVVAEDDVEAGVRERHRFGAAVDEREVHAGLGHQPAGVLELALREVEADRARAALGEGDRPLRGPAAELEDVPARDVAEDVQVRLGDLGGPPREPATRSQEGAVALLVLVAVRVPEGLVASSVRGQTISCRAVLNHRRIVPGPSAQNRRAGDHQASGRPTAGSSSRRSQCPSRGGHPRGRRSGGMPGARVARNRCSTWDQGRRSALLAE